MAAPSTASGELTLVLDRVIDGLGTTYLFQLKAGDELSLSGPFGNFVLPISIDRELLLISRYTGLVPIRCMLRELYAQSYRGPVFLIAIAPEEEELLFHHELLSLAVTHPGFRYLPLVAAAGLVETLAEAPDRAIALRLAAGGWASGTRVARGDVEMGTGFLSLNAAAVADRLRAFRAVLDGWQADLVGADADAIRERLAGARASLETGEGTDPRGASG